MSTVTKEIMNLARKAGYEGDDKANVTKAIDALADTLAGENLEQATNVAAAIRKLQPYVDGGGSGEVTSFTLENYNKVKIEFPREVTLQEDEVDAWIDEQIENWVNGQNTSQVIFDDDSNHIADKFKQLLDKNKNVVNDQIGFVAPAVGGGILVGNNSTVFDAITYEKEGITPPVTDLTMFHLSLDQEGYYHQLYAIRTEYDDNDLLVPLEIVDKFDAEELIEDTVTTTIPGEGDFTIPLVNYPSLNSPLSFDDYIAMTAALEDIEARIILCEIFVTFAWK